MSAHNIYTIFNIKNKNYTKLPQICTHQNRLNEAILMSTHNILFSIYKGGLIIAPGQEV